MTCHQCGGDAVNSGFGDYQYTESGLSNVRLLGALIRTCSSCGESEAVVPRISALHRALAGEIVSQPRFLTGSEVGFLRRALDFTPPQLAKQLGLDPCFMAIWPNIGLHPDLTTLIPADRLLRVLVTYRFELPLDIFELFPSIEPTSTVQSTFEASFDGDAWTVTTVPLQLPSP